MTTPAEALGNKAGWIAARPVELGPGLPAIGGQEPVICAPLVARTPEEALEQFLRLAARKPDLIEVRLDYLEGLAPEQTVTLLQALHAAAPVPLLATFRRQEEGGARPLAETGRLAILYAALESGAIRLLDVELQTTSSARQELLSASRSHGVATIISYHNFEVTPAYPALVSTLKELAATGADIVKMAVYPRTPEDTLNLLAASQEARTTFLDRPLVTMAMGALGGFTRLAGPFFGSALSFAVGENSSAPGQLEIDVVRALWQNWQLRKA
ncbi:MAG TPA: type I 3-dehydroquinate dehydratase [Chloroflexia bacterium]|nr:type I 3-dehydroquinate dehydratase [Chloroflexia bacterium]